MSDFNPSRAYCQQSRSKNHSWSPGGTSDRLMPTKRSKQLYSLKMQYY